MPGYSEYKRLQKIENPNLIQDPNEQFNQFYNDRKMSIIEPTVDDEGHEKIKFDYDPEQLMRYFTERNAKADEFRKRTEYYFTDYKVGQSKAQRYQELGRENNQTLNAYARTHSYHCASKRKNYANKASGAFTEMYRRMRTYAEEEQMLNSVEKYARQEEIMNYRIKGMHATAVTKAKSSKHGDFLSYKGKLSCYMILKDQLEHLITEETDRNLKRQLNNKLKSLNKKIDSAYAGVKKYAPKALDMWRDSQNMGSSFYDGKQAQYKAEAGIANKEKTKLLANLEKMQEYCNQKEWPACIVFYDVKGVGLTKAEDKADTWNNNYTAAKEGAKQGVEVSKKDLKTMDMEAVKRFNELHVPTPKELESVSGYIMDNLRDYYDLCKRALPYYKYGKLPENVKSYIKNNPAFKTKLEYVAAVNEYIDFALRNEFSIRYDNKAPGGKTKRWGKFVLENEPDYKFYKKKNGEWTRDKAYGQGKAVTAYNGLKRAFENYQMRLNSLSNGNIIGQNAEQDHEINIHIVNQIPEINIGNEIDTKKYDESIINTHSSVASEKLDESVSEDNKIIIEKEEKLDDSSNNIIIEEKKPVFIEKEKFEENIKIFEDKKEDVKEEKKEEKKKIDQNKINIFEPKKVNKEKEENLNKINIIEEKGENLNKINIIEEEGENLNKINIKDKTVDNSARIREERHKFDKLKIEDELKVAKNITGKQDIKVEDIALVREMRAFDSIGDNEKLRKAYEKAKKRLGRAGEEVTFERLAGPMFRTVHYNKGDFASKEDEENYKWNIAWFDAVEKLDYEKQEEMIEEEMSKCFDGIELPKPAELDKWIKKAALKNPEKVMGAIKKCIYMDNMKAANPVFDKYLKDHPLFDMMRTAYGMLNLYMQVYLKANTGYNTAVLGDGDVSDGGYIKKESVSKNAAASYKQEAEMYMQFYAEKYQEYKDYHNATKKLKVKKLNLVTKEEREEHKTKLHDKNPLFNGEGNYKILEAHSAVTEVYRDSTLQKKLNTAIAKGHIKRGDGNAALDLSRIPGSLLRIVHYDKDHKPIGEKDLVNAVWNNKVMTAFEKGDEKTLDEIIKEEIPKIYAEISIPRPPKNAGAEWFIRWIELNVMTDPEKWFDIQRRITAFSNLAKANKTAKKLMDEDKVLKAVDGIMPIIQQAASTYLKYKHRFDCERKGDDRVMDRRPGKTENDVRVAEEKLDDKLYEQLDELAKSYEGLFGELHQVHNNSYISDQSLEAEEFQYYNKKDPAYTEKSHKFKKRADRYFRAVKTNPVMLKAHKKAAKNFTGRTGGASVDRDARFFMKHVDYDDEFNPLTEKDKQNHQWNLDWLKAWENDDIGQIEKMMGENVEKIFENITKIPEPTQKELEAMMSGNEKGYADYVKKLEKWVEDIVSDGSVKFFEDKHNGLSIDTLKNTVPSFKKFLVDNPKFTKYSDSFDMITTVVCYMLSAKYHVDANGNALANDMTPYQVEKQQKAYLKSAPALFTGFAMQYQEYLEHKNDKTVPFQKLGIKNK